MNGFKRLLFKTPSAYLCRICLTPALHGATANLSGHTIFVCRACVERGHAVAGSGCPAYGTHAAGTPMWRALQGAPDRPEEIALVGVVEYENVR